MSKVLVLGLKICGVFITLLVLIFTLLLTVLTLFEYRPKDREQISGLRSQKDALTSETSVLSDKSLVDVDTAYTLLSWNIGYAGLSSEADFFMDGGTMVYATSRQKVNENLVEIASTIEDLSPDIILLQEVDRASRRSYKVNEVDFFVKKFSDYHSFFAPNYKTLFVPYPLPPLGAVDAGLLSLTRHKPNDAERIQLPVPFTWPIRLVNLKRCLLVQRFPLKQTQGKDLVIVNLHLEAYDDGEGKRAQTAYLKDFIESEIEAGNYVIAGGDFNQVFSSIDTTAFPVYSDMWVPGVIETSEFNGELQFLMDEKTPSTRSLHTRYDGSDTSQFQYYSIDGLILSSNIEVLDFSVLDLQFAHSDHNPTYLKFVLR